MSSYATLQDVISITGATYTEAEQTRINTLLPLVSDLIRVEGSKVGKDVDTLIANPAYSSVVKLVTHGLQPTRLLRSWGFPGKSTGVGCHCLLRTLLRQHVKK